MKIIDEATSPSSEHFVPVRPEQERDPYAALSDDQTLLLEVSRTLNGRARSLASAAARRVKDLEPKWTIPEQEARSLIEAIASDASAFLKQQPGNWPQGRAVLRTAANVAGSPPEAWQLFIQQLLLEAGNEPQPGALVILDQASTEICASLDRIQVAAAIRNAIDDIRHETIENTANFANSPEEMTRWESAIHEFLTVLMMELEQSSEAMAMTNLCLYLANEMLLAFNGATTEWQFFFSTMQMGIGHAAGHRATRVLHPLFEGMRAATGRFAYVGEIAREVPHYAEMQSNETVGLLYRQLAGEVLFRAAHAGISSTAERVISAVVERRISSEELRAARSQILRVCRPLGERNALDWVEEILSDLQNVADWFEAYEQHLPAIDQAIQQSVGSLRESIQSAGEYPRLAEDLHFFLRSGALFSLTSATAAQRLARTRQWFTTLFSICNRSTPWRHAKTILRSLRTNLNQANLPVYEGLFESRFALASTVDEMTVAALSVEGLEESLHRLSPAALGWEDHGFSRRERDSLLVSLRRLEFEKGLSGETGAARMTMTRMLKDGLIRDLADLEPETASRGVSLLQREEGADGLVDSLRMLTEQEAGCRGLASFLIWNRSEELALRTAQHVYERLPEYTERTGEGGYAKCRRDLGLTFDRLALALDPMVESPVDFLAGWWSGVVDAYLSTRPARLFQETQEGSAALLEQLVSGKVMGLIRLCLAGIYESASTEQEMEALSTEGAAWRLRAFDYTDALDAAGYLEGNGKRLAGWRSAMESFLQAAYNEAFATANGSRQLLEPLKFTGFADEPEAEDLASLVDGYCTEWLKEVMSGEWPGKGKPWLEGTLPPTEPEEAGLFLTALAIQSTIMTDAQKQLAGMMAVLRLLRRMENRKAMRALESATHALAGRAVQAAVAPDAGALSATEAQHFEAHAAHAIEVLGIAGLDAGTLEMARHLFWEVAGFPVQEQLDWQRLLQVAAQSEECIRHPEAAEQWKGLCERLQMLPSVLERAGRLHQAFARPQDPIFSSNAREEKQWRINLSTILALAALSESARPHAAWMMVCAMPPIENTQVFLERLDRVEEFLMSCLIDESFEEFTEAFRLTREMLEARMKQQAFLMKLEEQVALVAPRFAGIAPEIMAILLEHCAQWHGTHPPQLTSLWTAGFTREQLEMLTGMAPQTAARLRQAVVNSVPALPHQPSVAEKLEGLLQEAAATGRLLAAVEEWKQEAATASQQESAGAAGYVLCTTLGLLACVSPPDLMVMEAYLCHFPKPDTEWFEELLRSSAEVVGPLDLPGWPAIWQRITEVYPAAAKPRKRRWFGM